MRVYLSGPITGYANKNFDAFVEAAHEVQEMEHEAVSPLTDEDESEQTWEEYLREDLRLLLTCDAIYMMRGHEDSRGAALELHVASKLGYHIVYQP